MVISGILISDKGIGLSEDSFVLDYESEATVLLTVLEKYLELFDWVGYLYICYLSISELVVLIRDQVLLKMIIYSEGTHMNLFKLEDILIRTVLNSSCIFDRSIIGDLNLDWFSIIVLISDD